MTKVPSKSKRDAQVPPDSANAYAFPIPDCSPFDPSNGYAKLFAILYEYRNVGISRPDLLLCYKNWTSKDVNAANYEVINFLSVIAKGIPGTPYWIAERDGKIKLHLEPKPVAGETVGNSDDDYIPPVVNA